MKAQGLRVEQKIKTCITTPFPGIRSSHRGLPKENERTAAGVVAQVVQGLPSECEAPSSNPSITKKKPPKANVENQLNYMKVLEDCPSKDIVYL
jgi:hypothetical protein